MAAFFDSPKSQAILRTVAIIPVIRGLEPLFVTLAQKELRFAPIVILQILASIVGLAIGLIAACIRPDAWALVFSSLSVAIVMTVGAHLLQTTETWDCLLIGGPWMISPFRILDIY